MKIAGLIFLWLLTLSASAQTHPARSVCRNPVRVFPGKAAVDLAPLFQWWQRQPLVVTNGMDTNAPPDSDRPLPAWNLVTGPKLGVAGDGWIVNAAIYHSPTSRTNERVLLNHPPAVEEQAYYALRAQLDEADQRIARARAVYDAQTNAEAEAQRTVNLYRRSLSKVASDGVIAYSRIAAQHHAEAAKALKQLDQLETTRRQLDDQLRKIPAAQGAYQVEWFAVFLGRTKAGLAIYDLGLVSPAASP